MAYREVISNAFQCGWEKDQSVYRLVPATGCLRYDLDTKKCSPASVAFTVSKADGTEVSEVTNLSAEGLSVWRLFQLSGSPSTYVKVTGNSVTLPTDCSNLADVQLVLRRDDVDIDSVTIPVVRDGEAATVFELFSTNCQVHFNTDGSASVNSLSVLPFMVRGSERISLPVNDEAGAEYYCLFATSATDSILAMGSQRMKLRTVGESTVKSLKYGRFDLVPKDKATCNAQQNDGITGMWRYDTADVVASREVVITRDGINGTGVYTSVVFLRAASKPATPSGGTYSSPYPTSTPAWSDAPASGSNPLWLSRAVFSSEMDGKTGSPKPSWSTPELTESSSDVVFVWCAQATYSRQPNTPAFPYVPSTGDPWSEDATNAVWMAVAVKNSGVWGDWRITRIKGEGAMSVIVSPDTITGDADGNVADNVYVKLQLFMGSSEVKGFTFGSLCPDSSTGQTDPTVGVYWRKDTSSQVGGAGYLVFKNSTMSPSRILKDTVVTSYVEYEGVRYPFTFKFVRSMSGVRGATGRYQAYPRMWSDYPHEAGNWYHFESGKGENEDRVNLVFHGFRDGSEGGYSGFSLYRCIQSHDWASDKEPGTPGGAAYWQFVSVQPIWATNILLAQKAYIELLSSNGIRICTSDGRIVGQMTSIEGAPQSGSVMLPFFIGGEMDAETGRFANATGPLFGVDTDGNVYVGGTTGQRIEMHPGAKEMVIYDANGNPCAFHSGRFISIAEVAADTATGQAITVAASATGMKGSASNGASINSYALLHTAGGTNLTSYPTAPKSGVLKVSIPKFLLKARMQGSVTSGLVQLARAQLTIEVWAGTTKTNLQRRASVWLGTAMAESAQGEVTLTTEAKTLECVIAEGETYEVRAAYILVPTGSTGSASYAAQGSLVSVLDIPNQVAHYGCNGWYIATSNRNYEYHLFDSSGVLHVRQVANGVKIAGND